MPTYANSPSSLDSELMIQEGVDKATSKSSSGMFRRSCHIAKRAFYSKEGWGDAARSAGRFSQRTQVWCPPIPRQCTTRKTGSQEAADCPEVAKVMVKMCRRNDGGNELAGGGGSVPLPRSQTQLGRALEVTVDGLETRSGRVGLSRPSGGEEVARRIIILAIGLRAGGRILSRRLPRRPIAWRGHFRGSPEPGPNAVGACRQMASSTGSSSSRRCRLRRGDSSPHNTIENSNRASDEVRFTFASPCPEQPRCSEPPSSANKSRSRSMGADSGTRGGSNVLFWLRMFHLQPRCNRIRTHFRRYHYRLLLQDIG
ncbi:hypothetical protein LZ30DRAFT_683127 [Colletotrichum cereale]|nr:hypothetical protein LZ30DRAFT_683127 [Colletotrichum cereale]